MGTLYVFLVLLPPLFLLSTLYLLTWKNKKTTTNFPPKPPYSLPVIGHLHLVKKPLNRSLATMADRYGPIMFLQLGSRPVLVVSSPSLAEECLTSKNDVVFANRPRFLIGEHLGYNYTTLAWASYGHNWLKLRRITSHEIFSAKRLQMFSNIRADEVRLMIRQLVISASSSTSTIDGGAGYGTVDMKSTLYELMLNTMMRMMAGKRYYGEDVIVGGLEEEGRRFREIIKEAFELAGTTNIVDFLPCLRWVVGFKEIEKRMVRFKEKREMFMQELIEERRRIMDEMSGNHINDDDEISKKMTTMIDVLLSQQAKEPDYYTDQMIRGVIGLLLSAGTDTTAETMEWAMSLLLNNPEVLKKAQTEIDTYVGGDRFVDESDLANLPYLHAILVETLRMYPAGPILVPHESSDECTIGGYYVPGGTMLLVNIWAIQNDPKLWDEPSKFKPERFEELEVGEIREGFKCMPFGSGRRACPGSDMAMRVMGLALGSLIQCLEWKRGNEEEMVDMTEGNGLTMPKARPLVAKCKPRLTMLNLISQLVA